MVFFVAWQEIFFFRPLAFPVLVDATHPVVIVCLVGWIRDIVDAIAGLAGGGKRAMPRCAVIGLCQNDVGGRDLATVLTQLTGATKRHREKLDAGSSPVVAIVHFFLCHCIPKKKCWKKSLQNALISAFTCG